MSNPESLQSSLAVDLIMLASERSSAKRVELLRRVTDAYLDHSGEHSSAEQYFFQEVVSNIIDKIKDGDKAAASAKLATLPELPEGLARKLASDGDIDVARPIIRDYRGLPENVLLDIAKAGSQDHLNIIAGRHLVTPPISDVVVARGDRNVVRTLAANNGAEFSPRGMEELISKAEGDSNLQGLIVARGDLTIGAITKLLPLISDELACRLRGMAVEVDRASILKHLGDWAKDRQKNVERTDALIDRIRKNDLKLDDVVVDLVRTKRLFDSAAVIGSSTGLDRFYIFHILTVGKLDATLLLLRSVNLSWRAADEFLRLRAAKAGLGAFGALPTRLEYEAIDVSAAQRVVRFMNVRRTATAQETPAASLSPGQRTA